MGKRNKLVGFASQVSFEHDRQAGSRKSTWYISYTLLAVGAFLAESVGWSLVQGIYKGIRGPVI